MTRPCAPSSGTSCSFQCCADHRCQYQTRVRGLTCGHPGDVEGRHAQDCCAGPIQARHDRLRDEWARLGGLAHMAGWSVAMEQAVPINPPRALPRARRQPLASQEAGHVVVLDGSLEPDTASAVMVPALENHTIQADIVILTPGGKHICGDVACTHNWAPQTAAESIQAMEKVKYRKYGVNDSATLMAAGECFYPLVHHPSGHIGPAATRLATLIIADLASRMMARNRFSKSKAEQHAANLVYGCLGRLYQQQECRVLAASAPLAAARTVSEPYRLGKCGSPIPQVR
eukprot:1655335-Amphidinium_carterae.1